MRHLAWNRLLLGALLAGPAWAADTARPAETDDTDDTETSDTDIFAPVGGRAVTCDCGHAPGSGFGAAAVALGLALVRRRRLRGLLALMFAAVAALGAPSPAAAQGLVPQLDVHRFDPAGLRSGFVTTYSARQLPRLGVSFELYGVYAWNPLMRSRLVDRTYSQPEPAIRHLATAQARLGFAPTDWLQIAVSMPVLHGLWFGGGVVGLAGGRPAGQVGIGDVSVEVGFRAIPESKGVGLAITPFVSAPTGTRTTFLTDGTVAFGARAAVSTTLSFVRLAAYGGYKVKLGDAILERTYAIEDEVLYGLGVGFQIVPDLLRVNAELAGATNVGPGRLRILLTPQTDALHTALEASTNVVVTTASGFALVLGGGAGLTPAPGSPSVRGFVGLGYVPPEVSDTDADGIPDAADRCRRSPEDVDGFDDDDGCPESDNDLDGLDDPADRCPDDAEDRDRFQDSDGCPDDDDDSDGLRDDDDACPREAEDVDGIDDADGCPDLDDDEDGLLEPLDRCPDQPEDVDGDRDEDGCPDVTGDRDGDGLPDDLDPCEGEPEDRDGFQDDDGCPEVDNDGDGLLDAADRCPDAAEDKDGYQDADGCPDATGDADGDGVADEKDRCPEAAEIVNGVADDDGCPDEGKVRLTAERIEILERILFFVDEARIRPESFGVLDAVSQVLRSSPQIGRVRIEGHTDSQGPDAYNEDLSERRALAVRDYLVAAGISPARLLARGFGEAYPIAPNGTEEGRQQNRRVEFVILDATDPAGR